MDLVESFSGIRGIYGQGITEDLAYRYAMAYCLIFCSKKSILVIGGDSRPSTIKIKKAMLKAFFDFGIKKIFDVGITPIQVCEYAVVKFKASGGVYITASHNEPEYNGWKFLKEDGAILYSKQAQKLILEANKTKINITANTNKKIRIKIFNRNKEAIDAYVKYIIGKIGKKSAQKIKKKKFKILADPNGGSSISVLPKILKQLGVKAEIINKEPGKFSRLIEPNEKSLAYLVGKMDKKGFEFACGFDCDSDRVEFILPSEQGGQMISGNYVLALACDAMLKGTKGQIVPINDCTSYLVRDVAKKHGAKIKEAEVGETNVVLEIEKKRSIIGGEGSSSGVIVPPIKCRDGIMAMALILKLITEKGKISKIISEYPKYYAERAEKQCQPDLAIGIKNKIEKYFKSKGFKIKKTGGVSGGLKVLFSNNSFVWFRLSKTEQGKFRIIADGDDLKKVQKMLAEGIKLFDKFN